MNRYECRLLIIMAAVMLAGLTTAEPVRWEGNGHHYELVETPATWRDAELLATQRQHLGECGHLATITSSEENEFIFWQVVGGNQQTPLGDPWLGGYQDDTESPPGENWRWVTCESWEWTHWDEGEPNDYDEPHAEMYLNFQLWGDGFWNDHHSLLLKAFVVEYPTNATPTVATTLSDVKALFQ